MSTMSDLKENALTYLKGITDGDLDQAVSGFDQNAVLEFPFSALPVSRAEGTAEIKDVMSPVASLMTKRDFVNVNVTETDDPDLILLDFESDFIIGATGEPYRNVYHCVVKGRDGQVVQWTEYYDPRIAAASVGNEAMNIGVVIDYATNFQKEDSKTLVERVFHEDAEYLVNLPVEQCPETIDAIPWAGLWKGHKKILEFEGIFERNWTVDAITPEDIIAKDNEVIVFGQMVLTSTTMKLKADTPLMIRFTVEDGKIRKYHLMEDTYGVVLSHRKDGHFTIDNDGRPRPAPPK